MKRRTFLKNASGIAAGIAVPSLTASAKSVSKQQDMVAGLPRRVLGRTGEKVSVVGFPGLALTHYDQDRCNAGLLDAFKRGINYYDVAPAYGKDGICEIKMGIGLEATKIDRSKIFLACKTKKRDKEGSRFELERSLKRLKTDHFDLYQMHCLQTPDQVKQALGPGGAIETLLEAKKEGKVRYLGFSAHTTKAALDVMNGFRFDTAMFPINFVEFFKMGFGKPVLKLAQKQGVAVLAIKPMSKGPWPQGAERTRRWWYRSTESQYETDLAMRFILSKKPVVAGIPPSFLDLLDKAIEAGRSYRPIRENETKKLQEMAKDCTSLFRREEERVARGDYSLTPIYADSPHECCRGSYA
ncbi:MAG: aldo/keto reductase [Planctomycetota bacterium]|jgi:predicted aldo/keto reductase-like oxidoreductase